MAAFAHLVTHPNFHRIAFYGMYNFSKQLKFKKQNTACLKWTEVWFSAFLSISSQCLSKPEMFCFLSLAILSSI